MRTPGLVVIDDGNFVAQHRKHLRKDLIFVDDLVQIADLVDN